MAEEATVSSKELEELRQKEKQLREAQEVAGIGSWEWDMRLDKITWSENLYRIFGLEPNAFDATFDAYMSRIHPEDQAYAGEVVQKAMETLEPYSFDHRVVWPDDTVRWLHGQGAVEVADGKPVRMYGVAQDITEKRAAAEAKERLAAQEQELAHLHELNKARSTMLHTLAHEMNTPLTPMRMHAKLLQMPKLGALNQEQARSVEVLERNITRLTALIGDMLDVARVGDGQLTLSPQPTDLRDIVDAALASFEAEAANKGINLESVGDSVQVEVDPDRITQVVFNLVSNAIKFSDAGDTVTVRLHRLDGAVLEVEDEGIGIDPDNMEQLFQPFSRIEPDPERPGNGLGLHICQGIIEQHGGNLVVSSDGRGHGARFAIHLPA